MENFTVKINSIDNLTHDVLRFRTNKPLGFDFISGQATNISINSPKWIKEERPFTFTCLPANDYLEFSIKTYPKHKGVTNELLKLKPNDELILHEVFGAIGYKGKGVFICGGAGVTPFISIFRSLKAKKELEDNVLIFANKTKFDIILEEEFKLMLGDSFVNILAEEKLKNYHYGLITVEFLKSIVANFDQYFYICGPPPMIKSVESQIKSLGVQNEQIIQETF